MAALALPTPVLAHGLVGRVESPLPLAAYLGGAALAVALSFAFVIVRDVRAPAPVRRRTVMAPRWLVLGLRAVGLVAWAWIVVQAILGGSSDADVASLFLWVYGWVGLAILSALVGPVWSWLDPFATLYDIGAAVGRRLGIGGLDPSPYPERLGAWPAVAGLAVVIWLELAYRGSGLGVVLVGYTVLTLLAMANFGRDTWRQRGETFSVWFGTLNRLAPFGAPEGPGERVVPRRGYGRGLLEPGWTTAHVVLVAVGVASILYDGLSQTQIWFDVFGVPTLPEATLELAAFLGLLALIALAVARLVGLAAVGGGLVPIAVGYIVAHYLTFVLGDGQRIVNVLNDPFMQGWDLFGLGHFEYGSDWIPPVAMWAIMLGAVVGGHVAGAWAGHVLAVRETGPAPSARWRQVPLAALMVVLTATTLWSLGQVIVLEPGEPPAEQAASAPGRAAHQPLGPRPVGSS